MWTFIALDVDFPAGNAQTEIYYKSVASICSRILSVIFSILPTFQ